jgi:ATP-dependent Clp protease ATP-binding subunit ClpB
MVFSNFLMQSLRAYTVGQEYAVAALTRAITLALARLNDHDGALSVLLFVGATGSGKAHMARVLARLLLGDPRKMIWLNCQQFDQKTDPLPAFETQLVSEFWQSQIAPPYGPHPFRILVFEDIDKAPVSLRDHLVTMIDRRCLSLKGSFLPLSNSIIILISSLSKKRADQLVGRSIGFFLYAESALDVSRQHILALEEMDNLLGARLVSRIDEIIIFERLNELNVLSLLEHYIADIENYLASFSIGFVIGEEAKTFLLKKGVEDLTHGARQINRVVKNFLEFPLADLMLSGQLLPSTTLIVGYEPPGSFLHFQILIPHIGLTEKVAIPSKAG